MFVFKPETFVRSGCGKEDGELSERIREEVNQLRENHPELDEWGDLAIRLAWCDYCQKFFQVGDMAPGVKRDNYFLYFCCWQQTRDGWDEMNAMDYEKLEEANDWLIALETL